MFKKLMNPEKKDKNKQKKNCVFPGDFAALKNRNQLQNYSVNNSKTPVYKTQNYSSKIVSAPFSSNLTRKQELKNEPSLHSTYSQSNSGYLQPQPPIPKEVNSSYLQSQNPPNYESFPLHTHQLQSFQSLDNSFQPQSNTCDIESGQELIELQSNTSYISPNHQSFQYQAIPGYRPPNHRPFQEESRSNYIDSNHPKFEPITRSNYVKPHQQSFESPEHWFKPQQNTNYVQPQQQSQSNLSYLEYQQDLIMQKSNSSYIYPNHHSFQPQTNLSYTQPNPQSFPLQTSSCYKMPNQQLFQNQSSQGYIQQNQQSFIPQSNLFVTPSEQIQSIQNQIANDPNEQYLMPQTFLTQNQKESSGYQGRDNILDH